MGLFGKLLKDKIGDKISEGISKGIGDAVSKAAESAFAPVAEKITNKMAETLNEAADTVEEAQNDTTPSSFKDAIARLEKAAEKYENVMQNEKLAQLETVGLNEFPKYAYTQVRDIDFYDSEDEYYVINVISTFNDEAIEKYQNDLKANGFTGNFQLMEKIINGKKFVVNFTDVMDDQLQFLIYK